MTIKDIAKLSGVSTKTVSRVLNNSPEVKKETRKKVIGIMKKYGYQANLLAKGLRQKKTNTIIVFIDKHKGKYWGMWHNEMINEFFRQAKKRGYKIVVSPSSGEGSIHDDTDGFHLLMSGMVDGAIIFDNVKDDIRIKFLQEKKIPYVLIGKADDEKTHWVDLDNYQVGVIGARYLIEKGYKSICFMLGNKEFIVNSERAAGFDFVCSQNSNVKAEIIYGINSSTEAYDAAKNMLQQKPVRAFFISGDERAIGVYKAIQECNLSIPDDVAVLSIDNIELCDFLVPALSSIDQQKREMCRCAIEILISQLMKNEEQIESMDKKIILSPYIVQRQST